MHEMDSTFSPERHDSPDPGGRRARAGTPPAALADTRAATAEPGLYAAPWRALTIGLLALISILAFEQLAVTTVMPLVAQALAGPQWYAAAFGTAVAASIVGMVLAGRWCDAAGTRPGHRGRRDNATADAQAAASGHGARRALAMGVVAFALGVLLAGCAPSMPWLVLGRALQGLGSGLAVVAMYVVAAQAYPAALRPRLFAAFAAAWVAPVVVGPALASLIERAFGWRWVFLLAAVLTVPAALLLRQGLAARRGHAGGDADGQASAASAEAPAPAATPRPTLAWAALTAFGAAALHAGNAASAWVLLAGAAAVALGAPRLLPRGVWRARHGLSAVIALRGLIAAAFFCGEVLIPLLLIEQRGLSAFDAGLVLTVGALGWSAGSWWQGRLADAAQRRAREAGTDVPARTTHRRQRRLLGAGFTLLALGTLLTLAALHPTTPLALAALGWTVAGLGIGMAFPTLAVLLLALAPAAEQGRASAALQLADSLCSALALALAGGALAALRPAWPQGAFIVAFALAAALALLGAALSPRVQPR